MAELYLERDAGRKHTPEHISFKVGIEYKLKPETLEDAADKCFERNGQSNCAYQGFKEGAKWAWANPESKE